MRYARLQTMIAASADLSQLARMLRIPKRQKNGPEIGAIKSGRNANQGCLSQAYVRLAGSPNTRASEAEIGEVTVTDRSAGAGHEQPVEHSDQAAERAFGRRESDGSSLGHCRPLS